MVLEDIPEMQVMESYFSASADMRKDFTGKFITIKFNDGRTIICSERDGKSHQGIYDSFLERAVERYGEAVWALKSKVTGGGRLTINSSDIKLDSKSDKYEKYSIEVVQPIIQRFAEHHLPNHKITFE